MSECVGRWHWLGLRWSAVKRGVFFWGTGIGLGYSLAQIIHQYMGWK